MQQSIKKLNHSRYYAHDADTIFLMQKIEKSNPLGVAEYRKIETALVTLTIYLMQSMEKGHPSPPRVQQSREKSKPL
jgi:hypothetical protein